MARDSVQIKLWGDADAQFIPVRETPGSAAYDVRAHLPGPVTIKLHQTVRIPLGFAIAIPFGWTGLIRDRSGLSYHNLLVVGGLIDPDYDQEVMVQFTNNQLNHLITIDPFDRCAQLLIVKSFTDNLQVVDELPKIAVAHVGFGSTGVR